MGEDLGQPNRYEVANEIYAHSNKDGDITQKACSPKLLFRSWVEVNEPQSILCYDILIFHYDGTMSTICKGSNSKIPNSIQDNMTGLWIDTGNPCEIINF